MMDGWPYGICFLTEGLTFCLFSFFLQLSPAAQQMQPTQTLQSGPPSGGRRRRVVDEDPDERRRKFLERNRAAATRCRQKRKVWVMSLEKKAEELTQTNMQLQVWAVSQFSHTQPSAGNLFRADSAKCIPPSPHISQHIRLSTVAHKRGWNDSWCYCSQGADGAQIRLCVKEERAKAN